MSHRRMNDPRYNNITDSNINNNSISSNFIIKGNINTDHVIDNNIPYYYDHSLQYNSDIHFLHNNNINNKSIDIHPLNNINDQRTDELAADGIENEFNGIPLFANRISEGYDQSAYQLHFMQDSLDFGTNYGTDFPNLHKAPTQRPLFYSSNIERKPLADTSPIKNDSHKSLSHVKRPRHLSEQHLKEQQQNFSSYNNQNIMSSFNLQKQYYEPMGSGHDYLSNPPIFHSNINSTASPNHLIKSTVPAIIPTSNINYQPSISPIVKPSNFLFKTSNGAYQNVSVEGDSNFYQHLNQELNQNPFQHTQQRTVLKDMKKANMISLVSQVRMEQKKQCFTVLMKERWKGHELYDLQPIAKFHDSIRVRCEQPFINIQLK